MASRRYVHPSGKFVYVDDTPQPAEPQTLGPPGAVHEMMRAEIDDKEYGVVGEWANPQPVEQTPSFERWTPPPADWAEEARERREREKHEELLQKLAEADSEQQPYPAQPKRSEQP